VEGYAARRIAWGEIVKTSQSSKTKSARWLARRPKSALLPENKNTRECRGKKKNGGRTF
jgi:hypothetical protein